MSNHTPEHVDDFCLSRRGFLQRCGLGFGAWGLASLLSQSAHATAMAPGAPHFAPRAKRVVHIFFNGGLSHIDSFDPKPELAKYAGNDLPMKNLKTERPTGAALPSPFEFTPRGESGLPVSSLFEHVGDCADDLCVIRSMHADVPNHEPSLLLMNCGDARLIRPSVGSWVTYGLGTENENLPGFISMCPNGYPIQESQNWQAGFLPGVYQGAYVDTKHTEIDKLIANIENKYTALDLLHELNAAHLAARANDGDLETRIESFELAYRMQLDATDAFDVSREPEHIRTMYGDGVHARQCLITRRLLERGVRFIQLWHGAGQPWDSHDDLEKRHSALAKQCDQPIGALLKDLKQRGMLEETLILMTGEFGRTPTVELPTPGANAGKLNGRDHNHYGFSAILAGGGVKGGYAYGATDEFGFQAVEKRVHVHDLHATMLKLLGFDHEQFTYRYAGRDFRLTDVHGHIVDDIIA